jgi:hypothetical protein
MRRLEEAGIHFALDHVREGAVMIRVAVPGQRWEIELVDYGDELHWEIERFLSNGSIEDESALAALFANFSDEAPTSAQQAAAGL